MTTGILSQGRQLNERREAQLPEDLDSMADALLGVPETPAEKSLISKRQFHPASIERLENGYMRRIAIEADSGNWEAAKEILAEAERNAGYVSKLEPLLEVSLAEIGVPVRECNALESCGIITIGDLPTIKHLKILKVPNVGPRTLDLVWWSVLKLADQRDAMREVAEANYEDLSR